MSKPDNKWVDKIRSELTSYSPKYNATDWAALEKSLPVAKGWFGLPKAISNWIKGALVFIVPAVTILAVYLYATDTNLSENKISTATTTVVDNKIDESQISVPAETNSAKAKQTVSGISENKTGTQKPDKKITSKNIATTEQVAASENKKTVERKTSVTKTLEKESIQAQASTSVSSNKKNTTTDKSTKKDNIIQGQSDNNVAIKTTATNVKQSSKTTTQNSSANSTALTENSTKTANQTNSSTSTVNSDKKNKTAGKTIAATTAATTSKSKKTWKKNKSSNKKNKPRKNNRSGKRNRSRNKAKKPPRNKQPLPLFIGPSGSAEFTINPEPYNSKLNFAGGITFEKFITKNSSLSVTPEFFAGNFKYTETIPGDSIITPNPPDLGDSLHTENPPTITVNPPSEKDYTLKLLYLDFPVAFNYYIFNKKQYRLALFVGVSNKYIFSIEKNGEKQQLTNKFYLAQSATFGAIYKRQINKNLFFDIEPYVIVPLRKIKPENYSWTSFGVKVNLLFNITGRK